MINLKRYNNALVTPKDDALLYDFIINDSGVLEGLSVAHLGANQLLVSAGRGIIMGRDFTADEETILAQLSPSGTQQGRLIIRIDMANTESPVEFATQVAPSLPPLVQEDINRSGTIYELTIATYDADELQISNLVHVAPMLEGISADYATRAGSADTAKNGIYTLTHSKAGTVHTPGNLPTAPGLYTANLTPTADYNEGDTWADGWTAELQGSGEPLPNEAFKAGKSVSVLVDTVGKKLGFKSGGGDNKTMPPPVTDLVAKAGNAEATITFTEVSTTYDSVLGDYILTVKQGGLPTSDKDGKRFIIPKTAASVQADYVTGVVTVIS